MVFLAGSRLRCVLWALAFPCFHGGLLALPLCRAAVGFGCFLRALAFPCVHGGLLALPLCGAALTFFAAAKKVSKESGLTPPVLKWVPWLGGGSGASGISAFAHSALVTSCLMAGCFGWEPPWVCSLGVGLSLCSRWSIGVAPVRGGTYFLCLRKESKQRKRAHTASS